MAASSAEESLSSAAAAAGAAYELAHVKYEAGLTDFSTLLDAQRSCSPAGRACHVRRTVTSNLVRLYKSLGGAGPLTQQIKRENH
jgi:outer membrane protein TolC